MHSTWFARFVRPLLVAGLSAGTLIWSTQDLTAQNQRPMTFLDMQHLNRGGAWTPSPDGEWMLYTVTEPDWEDDERQTDIHLVSLSEGLPSHRQMTYTDSKDETSPRWAKDGSLFAFLSDRESEGDGGSQIFVMPPDGGEARRITDAEGGVSNFEFSPDGSALVFRAGKGLDNELYRISMDALFDGDAEAITDTEAGINDWAWSPEGDRIFFVTPDERDHDEERRKKAGFTVDIRNAETPLASLWVLDVASERPSRLTNDGDYTVSGFTISDDGRWVGYRGISSQRYERNITEQGINADLYLLEVATGAIERLTDNDEVGEQGPSFSPDGRWVAFAAPRNLREYSFDARKVYVREVDDRGGEFRRLGDDFEEHMSIGFWSDDSETIYFNAGVRARRGLMALDVSSGEVEAVTDEDASLFASRHDESGTLLINYADPRTPPTVFAVKGPEDFGQRARWTQLVDLNPQVRELALGEESEITWTSTDGHAVSGVLVKPVGFQEGTRYPLIVAIHGGPASADVLGFNGGYGAQVYAGAGYAVLRPNYRGSTNYGEEFRVSIAGDYFPQAFDDIMAGVDHLIAEGIVDGDRMGALGWSAGGHWSNWILTHTDRFKAISSGAGTMNWISMYAQSDVQRNRQFYLGNELMYENFDPYWDQSPLKYIADASTPTMVHVVEGDPRVPSPQSVELHMALKKLEVPTELFMYPGQSHGIPDPRNRLVKSVSEMAWMDYYVRGLGDKFDWRQVLETLPEEERPRAATEDGAGGR